MKCFGIFFHKWEYVRSDYDCYYLNEVYRKVYTSYRICQKCGKVQFNGVGWETLSENQSRILKKKIKKVGGKDYYVLRDCCKEKSRQ